MDLEHTLLHSLGIKTVTLNQDQVILTMPVDARTHQPAGFLHGGASVALADTAASIGASLNVESEKIHVFGVEINANYSWSKRDGTVTAEATPLHIGKTTMVWNINITDEDHNRISVSRCTIGVVPK